MENQTKEVQQSIEQLLTQSEQIGQQSSLAQQQINRGLSEKMAEVTSLVNIGIQTAINDQSKHFSDIQKLTIQDLTTKISTLADLTTKQQSMLATQTDQMAVLQKQQFESQAKLFEQTHLQLKPMQKWIIAAVTTSSLVLLGAVVLAIQLHYLQ